VQVTLASTEQGFHFEQILFYFIFKIFVRGKGRGQESKGWNCSLWLRAIDNGRWKGPIRVWACVGKSIFTSRSSLPHSISSPQNVNIINYMTHLLDHFLRTLLIINNINNKNNKNKNSHFRASCATPLFL
jgi:hypothetical protein